MNDTLTEAQWQSAHKIAVEFVKEQQRIEPNKEGISAELDKIIAYFHTFASKSDAGNKFFKYIKELVGNGRQIGHTGKTPEYYQSIDQFCDQYLRDYEESPQVMLQILGWTSRLMRYYKTAPIAERDAKLQETKIIPQTQRQEEIRASIKQNFAVGDISDGKVIKKSSGNKVTYELVGTSIRNTLKESKMFDKLEIDQIVKVELTDVTDDGIPKKFKRMD